MHDGSHKTSAKHDIETLVAKSSVLSNATPSNNPISSFCYLPSGMTFDVQHSTERILLLMRQHFIVNTGWIFTVVFLGFLPTLFPFLPALTFLPATFQRVLILSWYLFLCGFSLERFVVWYYNVYIITNERLIDVDFYSLLFKRVSETKLEHIQDITVASGGVVQSFFDYGDVMVQTAAEVPEIEFEKVPHPDLVTKLISELIDTPHRGNKRKHSV